MSDYATKRRHMVVSQLRPNGITDVRITTAMLEMPREAFVPAPRQALAYIDEDLALAEPQKGVPARFLMEPMIFARLVQLADVRPGDSVLDVGCALGYSTAILAQLGGAVIGLEEDAALVAEANDILAAQGLANTSVIQGPLPEGHAKAAPFDVIFVNGQVGEIPAGLLDQLKDGGRLVAIIDHGPVGKASLFSRHGSATSKRVAFDASVGRLPGFEVVRPGFVF